MARQKYRIILVEPEYEINLGASARLMANFSCSPLYIVNPKCQIGFTAKMHAKHATKILEKAVICKSLSQAISGCSFVAGTTGVLRRHRHALRHPLSLEQFRERLSEQKEAKSKHGSIAILFGREGIGLSEKEIRHCDCLIHIPTSASYPVMNLSHSLAIVLYSLCAQNKKIKQPGKPAAKSELGYLNKTFDLFAQRYKRNLRNPEKTRLAFRRILGRAVPDETETRAVLGVLRQALKELQSKQ